MLRQYNGKATDMENTDLASNYLGYWMDNGAFYYYNTLPNTSYQDTVLELHANLSERIPVRWKLKFVHLLARYVNYCLPGMSTMTPGGTSKVMAWG